MKGAPLATARAADDGFSRLSAAADRQHGSFAGDAPAVSECRSGRHGANWSRVGAHHRGTRNVGRSLVLAASMFGGQLGRYLVAVTPRYWPEAQHDHAQQAAHLVGATQAARMPR